MTLINALIDMLIHIGVKDEEGGNSDRSRRYVYEIHLPRTKR